MSQSLAATLEQLVFAKRHLILVSFAIVTAIMGYFALQLRPDAGFEKSIPLKHPYMQTFVEHQAEFGGANRILIALSARDGDIFSADFFHALKAVRRKKRGAPVEAAPLSTARQNMKVSRGCLPDHR